MADVVAALLKSDVVQSYVDIKAGKVLAFGQAFSEEAGTAEETEEERLEHVFAVEDNWQQYIALPDIYDLYEREFLQDFLSERLQVLEEAPVWQALLAAPGGLSRLKRQMKHQDAFTDWQRYFQQRLFQIARDWCEENQIPYQAVGTEKE